MHRADVLHAQHAEGFSPKAHTLSVLRHIVQLRRTTHGGYVVLVWVWLSDGSKFRCSWLLAADEWALYRTWNRVPWASIIFRNAAA